MTPKLFFIYEKDQPHRFAFVSVYDSFIITIYFVANKDFTNIRRCILRRKKKQKELYENKNCKLIKDSRILKL